MSSGSTAPTSTTAWRRSPRTAISRSSFFEARKAGAVLAKRKKRRKTALDRLRDICLALPEAEERETWELPTFRVRDKIYAMYVEDEDDRPGIWCKAPPGNQTHLVEADPDRFFVPPYVGHKGWIGMHLDRRVTWREVAIVVERSYRMTAPKTVLRRLEALR